MFNKYKLKCLNIQYLTLIIYIYIKKTSIIKKKKLKTSGWPTTACATPKWRRALAPFGVWLTIHRDSEPTTVNGGWGIERK
jgi:hypothetical protein